MYPVEGMETLSVAVMVGQYTLAIANPGVVKKYKTGCKGQFWMSGGVVSMFAPSFVTVPVNVHEALFPAVSVAMYVKKVVPKSTKVQFDMESIVMPFL